VRWYERTGFSALVGTGIERRGQEMTPKRVFALGLVLYAVLGLTDLALTYLVIRGGIGYEANPVAEAWLHRYGWEGLAAFKVLSAAVFGSAVAVIARHRPRTSAVLVAAGCVALLLVVLHSRRMLDEAGRRGHVEPGELLAEYGD
jgi:hypothetical protein